MKGYKKIKVIEKKEITEYAWGSFMTILILGTILGIGGGLAFEGEKYLGSTIGLLGALLVSAIIIGMTDSEKSTFNDEKEVWVKK